MPISEGVSKGVLLEMFSNKIPLNSATEIPSLIALSAKSLLLCLTAKSMISFEFLLNSALASSTV